MSKFALKMKDKVSLIVRRSNTFALYSVLSLLTLALLANCSYRTPALETPAPGPQDSEQNIDKTFFGAFEKVEIKNANGKAETKEVWKPKTFLCGWAALEEVGSFAKATLLHNVNNTNHCNLQFEITEHSLIGRKIDPTHPVDAEHPDARKNWKQVVTIPILSHFYYEREKDAQGRDTNRYIENDQRSDYRERPKIKLDLKGTSIVSLVDSVLQEPGSSGLGSISITTVDDIEWDHEKGFLGFNATILSPAFGSEGQARIRFNFLEFKSNPNFKVTRYNDRNSRYFNTLYILGKKVELGPVLYAGKWDADRTHEIYLYGFPEDYVSIAEDVVNHWNDAFAEIGKPRPFKLNKTKMKYPFDLRYPMIVWVDDKETALSSPLGIAMSQADVTNGEILWGGVVVWGGLLEGYIKSSIPTAVSGASSFVAGLMPKILDLGPDFLSPSANLKLPPGIESFSPVASFGKLQNYFQGRSAMSRQQTLNGESQMSAEGITESVLSAMSKLVSSIQTKSNSQFGQKSYAEMLPIPRSDANALKDLFGDKVPSGTNEERENEFRNRIRQKVKANGYGIAVDRDRTFATVAPWWSSTLADKQGEGEIAYEKALRSVIKEIVMHEVGHFMGLGHQFKENILPERGTVPDSMWKKLEAKAKENSINFTSVMGYKHGITDVSTPYEDIAPGPQDKLVMQYLYNNKYATVKIDPTSGKIAEDKFTFFDIPAGGEIPTGPKDKPEYVTRYFPACNDFDATFSADPYCNRWDRGYNAETIVKNYFETLNSNLISRLISFTDARGGNTDYAEFLLWHNSYDILGRVRLFYDYMRQKYSEVLTPILLDKTLPYEFSQSCNEDTPSNKYYADLFKQYPDLKMLCRVNSTAIDEYKKFLTNSGPDFSEIDFDNSYMSASDTGGDAQLDSSRAFGTRRTLSVLPRKFAALNALTTPRPYFFYGPWMVPVPRFSEGTNGKFVYSSLYPEQFTETIAATIEKNMKLKKSGQDQADLGRAALGLGWFLSQNFQHSAESGRVESGLLAKLSDQTTFDFRTAAIIFKKVASSSDPNRVVKFTVTIFDFISGRASNASEGYVLPDGKIIVRGPERTFIYPISSSSFTFADDETGIALAYVVKYNPSYQDMLQSHGMKAKFETLHKDLLDNCIGGLSKPGLSSFFKGSDASTQEGEKPADAAAPADAPKVAAAGEFQGFEVIPGIATDGDKQRKFFESVRTSFDAFYGQNITPKPDRNACDDSLEGLGLIVSEAAILNGYWIPEILHYLH